MVNWSTPPQFSQPATKMIDRNFSLCHRKICQRERQYYRFVVCPQTHYSHISYDACQVCLSYRGTIQVTVNAKTTEYVTCLTDRRWNE